MLRITAPGRGSDLALGALDGQAFRAGTGRLAQDADDRFLFRITDRTLCYDADGQGGATSVPIATFDAGASLTAADLLIV